MFYTYAFKKTNYSPLLFIILFFFSLHGNAQSPAIDSLKLLLKGNPTLALKANIYNELAWETYTESYNLSYAYADSAIQTARSLSDKAILSKAYMRASEALEALGKLTPATAYVDSSLTIATNANDRINIARAENRNAALQRQLKNLNQGLKHARRAVAIYSGLKMPDNYATAMNILANIFKDRTEYDSSIFYYDRSLQIRRERNQAGAIAESLLNLGDLYWEMGNAVRAFQYNRESLRIYQSLGWDNQTAKVLMNMGNVHYDLDDLDSSDYYNQKSLEIRESNDELTHQAHFNFNNLGNIEMARNNLAGAKEYHNKAYKYRKEKGLNQLYLSELNLGNIERLNQRYSEAERYYESALAKIDSLGIIDQYPEILLWLSSVSSALDKNAIAQKYLNRYNYVLKEINKKISKANNLEGDLKDARYKVQYNEVVKAKQQITIYALIGGLVLLVLLFFVIIRLSQMRNKNLQIKQNEALQREKIQQLIKEKEIDAMNAMVEGQENERLRIARDLHDRLGGTLSIVKMHFKSVEESIEALKETSVKQYKEANDLLDEACEEVRKIAHDMSSGVLMKFGLVAALKDLKATVEATGQLNMNFLEIGLQERLDYEYEINIYRIIQELITNTLKHAKASEMTIQLYRKDDRLSIVVEDDGIGFNQKEKQKEGGMGIANIDSRVQRFEGEMNIDSGKGAGTTITIDLPINSEKL